MADTPLSAGTTAVDIPTSQNSKGGRKNRNKGQSEGEGSVAQGGENVPTVGEDGDESLTIRIRLNLRAKVKLELEADLQEIMAFARRLAILPGGLGGLGSSIGNKLRQQGARLAILYAPFEAARRDELLDAGYGSAPSGNNDIRAYECDITSPQSVESAFSALKEEMVSPSSSSAADRVFPNILINTAGYVSLSDMELTPPEETMKHLTTNVLGPMLCSQAFARMYFDASKKAESSTSPPPPGRIVSISSQAAHAALHRHGAYCASKAALLGLTRSMASEWAPRGITSNTVSPTVAWTALGKKAWGEDSVREAFLKTIPTGKFALPEDVADAVLFLCQDSSGMINGADIRVDGGFTIR
ncbi:hypothetical protein BDV59DRAFT_195370 [Aspergillus ambiguus]|uniref:putative short-chain dehydrogenase/reductase n=1 Tax=Aspergillus ambiguus TaxID=176160 RepID=UPI003CCD245F